MQELLGQEGIQQQIIPGKNPTRENFIVMETSVKKQYRFGFPGAKVSQAEA